MSNRSVAITRMFGFITTFVYGDNKSLFPRRRNGSWRHYRIVKLTEAFCDKVASECNMLICYAINPWSFAHFKRRDCTYYIILCNVIFTGRFRNTCFYARIMTLDDMFKAIIKMIVFQWAVNFLIKFCKSICYAVGIVVGCSTGVANLLSD